MFWIIFFESLTYAFYFDSIHIKQSINSICWRKKVNPNTIKVKWNINFIPILQTTKVTNGCSSNTVHFLQSYLNATLYYFLHNPIQNLNHETIRWIITQFSNLIFIRTISITDNFHGWEDDSSQWPVFMPTHFVNYKSQIIYMKPSMVTTYYNGWMFFQFLIQIKFLWSILDEIWVNFYGINVELIN